MVEGHNAEKQGNEGEQEQQEATRVKDGKQVKCDK